MPEIVRRGYMPSDAKEFCGAARKCLQEAQTDIVYLMNRGYGVEQAVTFVGNRYQFSARQRTALTRASATRTDLKGRADRLREQDFEGETLYIDGFNLIITLESALSGTTMLFCMDGTLRDLCGLHGTYRLIDKTALALRLIAGTLREMQVAKTVFYLDAPVSNSGRLKQQIERYMQDSGILNEVILVPNADAELWGKDGVVTSDADILNRCGWWINLVRRIVAASLPDLDPVELTCGIPWRPNDTSVANINRY